MPVVAGEVKPHRHAPVGGEGLDGFLDLPGDVERFHLVVRRRCRGHQVVPLGDLVGPGAAPGPPAAEQIQRRSATLSNLKPDTEYRYRLKSGKFQGRVVPFRTLPAEDATASASGPMVLVCDDDPAILEVVGTLLGEHGYGTRGVRSAEELLALAAREAPAAIVLDLLMPGTNGWQALTRLRAEPRTANVPVIIVSAVQPVGTRPERVGAFDWLGKPLDTAVVDGRLEIVNQLGRDERDFAVPVVYLEAFDGVVFYVSQDDYRAMVRELGDVHARYGDYPRLPDTLYGGSAFVRMITTRVLEHPIVAAERPYDFRKRTY